MSKPKTTKNLTIATLIALGLSENEATLYTLMLSYPRSTVQELVVKSPFPRTLLYYVLKKLEEKSLITSKKQDWKTVYIPENPEKLYELLSAKESEFEKQKQAIKELIPNLRDGYQLKNKRPTVKVFEGIAKYEQMLEDTLLGGTKQIYVYENFQVNKPALECRESYERKRVMRRVMKSVLFFENKDTLKELAKIPYNDYTNFRSIKPNTIIPFTTDIILYNGKIIYTTYSEHEPVAVLIEDSALYEMQKNIFESIWKQGEERTLYFTQVNK